MEFQVEQLSDLNAAATLLLDFAKNEKVFLFSGSMSAGKTTFIKALCTQLGVTDSVSSPTYSIVNEYAYPGGKIFHFDFFRIKTETEAYDLGFEEYLYSGDFCFIEWPEMIKDLWPQHYITVEIEQSGADGRLIKADII